jgi:hypothetical protein
MFNLHSCLRKIFWIKGALGAPEGHQIDTRFVLGQQFRNEKRYVYQRKALEIWRNG